MNRRRPRGKKTREWTVDPNQRKKAKGGRGAGGQKGLVGDAEESSRKAQLALICESYDSYTQTMIHSNRSVT